ncbi:MAG: hypothetical protein KF764_04185 [Labilithrix sp.]|nr:hypothetical protein [Labilithrix sp.]
MLKKLLVAALACLTIFLSKRALLEPQPHAGPEQVSATNGGAAIARGHEAALTAARGHEAALTAIRRP